MNDERDLCLLLFVLIVFSASVGLLHGDRKSKANVSSIGKQEISIDETLSIDQIYLYLKTLLIPKNIDLLAKEIGKFKVVRAKELLQKVITDKQSPLTADEKVRLSLAALRFRRRDA